MRRLLWMLRLFGPVRLVRWWRLFVFGTPVLVERPSDEQVARARQVAFERGWLRPDGSWVWDERGEEGW